MVQALVTGGVGIYGFYALQPYLLDLYGDPHAYVVAGLSAAIVAGAQILGGLCAPLIRKRFRRRTSALLLVAALSAVTLLGVGLFEHFWAAIALAVVWALLFAASMPIRQAYLNGLIPSRERATILSFDSLMTSSGGVWAQPALGRAADAWSYPTTYLISAAITLAGLPFVALSRRQNAPPTSASTASDSRLKTIRWPSFSPCSAMFGISLSNSQPSAPTLFRRSSNSLRSNSSSLRPRNPWVSTSVRYS